MEISVIIPVYNAASFVEEAVLSALNQPETGEVILIEDGSSDNSLEVCKSLEEKYVQVKLLTHENYENKGEAASRNLGIRNAQFDYICFLDADDYFLENRFKYTQEVFSSNPNIDGVYEAILAKFENDSVKKRWIDNNINSITTINRIIESKHLFDFLYFGSAGYFAVGGVTVKKSLFELCGLFDESLKISPDTNMWLKMSITGNLYPGSIKIPVSIRRVHDNNTISKVSKQEMLVHRLKLWASLARWVETINCKSKIKALIKFKKFHYERILNMEESKQKESKWILLKSLVLFTIHSPLKSIIVLSRYFVFYVIKRV